MSPLNKFYSIVVAAGAFVFGSGQLTAQVSPQVYGLTFFDNQLLSINTTTGAGSLIANLNQSVTGYGLAFRGSSLYTFDPTLDRIREINVMTGAVGAGINIGVGNLTGEGDLAFRSDGIGFLSSALAPDFSLSNDLFRFDLGAGTSTRIGTTSVVLDAMAFFGSTLYAIGQEGTPSLYIVNQTNASLTMVGSLGLQLGSPFSALTVGMNGMLFAALDDRLYGINPLSGLASVLDPTVLDIGFSSVSGLAAMPSPVIGSAVPEPSTYGLIASLGLILGCVARCRISKRRQTGNPCS